MRAATRQRVIRITARPLFGTINKVEIDIAPANLSQADVITSAMAFCAATTLASAPASNEAKAGRAKLRS
jgi:hypothetical protein